MAKVYRATIQYTIYPDENGLLEGDFDIYDEDEIKDNHRTPEELRTLVRVHLELHKQTSSQSNNPLPRHAQWIG